MRSADVPATAAMLYESEERLIHRMDMGFQELRAEIHGNKSEFQGMKSDIHGMRSDIHAIKSDIHSVKSEIHGVKSELHRVALLVEEQNARNKYVMDGYAQLYEFLMNRSQV